MSACSPVPLSTQRCSRSTPRRATFSEEDPMAETQTYATHRRWVPYFHFFALPILGLNVLVQIYFLIRQFAWWGVWNILVAAALAALAVATRSMATTAQDRIIRL